MPERTAGYPTGRRSSTTQLIPAKPVPALPVYENEADPAQQQRDSLLPDAPIFGHPPPAQQTRRQHQRQKSSSSIATSERPPDGQPRTMTYIETLDAAKAARKSISYSQGPPKQSTRHQKTASTGLIDVNGDPAPLHIATAAVAAPVVSPLPNLPRAPTSTSSSSSNSPLVHQPRGRATSPSSSRKPLPLAVNTRYKPSGLSSKHGAMRPDRAASPTLSVSSGHTGWGSSHGFASAPRSTRSASRSPGSPRLAHTPGSPQSLRQPQQGSSNSSTVGRPSAMLSIYRQSPQRATEHFSPSDTSSVAQRRSSQIVMDGVGSSSPSSVGSDASRAALLQRPDLMTSRHASPGTSVVSGGTSLSGSPSSSALTDFSRRTDSPLLRRSSSNNVSLVGTSTNVSATSLRNGQRFPRTSMALSTTSLHGLLPNPQAPTPPKKADADLLIPRGATRRSTPSMISTGSTSSILIHPSTASPRESRQRMASPTLHKSDASPLSVSTAPSIPGPAASSPRVSHQVLSKTLPAKATPSKGRSKWRFACLDLRTRRGKGILAGIVVGILFLLALLFYFLWPTPPSLTTTRQNTGTYSRSTGVMTQAFYLQAVSRAYIAWPSTRGMVVQSMSIAGSSMTPQSATSAPFTLPSHGSGVSVPITITHTFTNASSDASSSWLSALQDACHSATTGSVSVTLIVDAGLDVWSKFDYVGNTLTTADWPCYA